MTTIQLTKDTTLYVSQIIDNLPDLAQYFGADTEEIVNHAQRQFKATHRQHEWLTVRAMLRHALGPDARIQYTESGKPLLTLNSLNSLNSAKALPPRGGAGRGSVSVSHSKTHAALLLSTHSDIGVDIECVSHRVLRLASRIAQPDELPESFATMTDDEKALYLTTLWTIKEAVYKSLDHQAGFDLLTDVRVNPHTALAALNSMVNGEAVARTCICCRRSRCKSCRQVRERSVNPQSSILNPQSVLCQLYEGNVIAVKM